LKLPAGKRLKLPQMRRSTPAIEPAQGLRELSRQLIVVVGASGVGKDALVQAWVRSLPPQQRPHVARRVITRERHPSEDHEPVSVAAFQQLLAAQRLAFDWQAHGLHYGVRWEELAPLGQRRFVLVNGSRHHLPALRELAPRARVIEVTVPDVLRQERLAARGREDASAVAARLERPAPAAPAEWGVGLGAELVVDNSGALHDAVRQLQCWWSTTHLAADPRT
jgi:phosphonate metabolism protein PhnN/1,5-bisphosphokinase (PRPP-forming)